MKRILFAICAFSAFLFAPLTHAQARLLVGADGGETYSNVSFGVDGRIEVPFAKHFELDSDGTFAPFERKISLGSGHAYSYGSNGFVWFTKSLAVDGGIRESGYAVTSASKAEYFVNGGLTYRTIALGAPVRFGFDYVREVQNQCAGAITYAGGKPVNCTEANHLQGGDFSMDVRMGCTEPMCMRMLTAIEAGRVLNQGNPQCDGTFGEPVTCHRTGTMGGGARVTVYFEFPRRRDTENDPF